ncbi:hypothetical protein S245_039080, partial [Arachis hypogaea]
AKAKKQKKKVPKVRTTPTQLQEPRVEIPLSQSAPLQPEENDANAGPSVPNNSNQVNHGAQAKTVQTMDVTSNTTRQGPEQQNITAETGLGTAPTFKFIPTP